MRAPIKAVPGRKTDMRDGEWMADLLRHGLVKASFIESAGKRQSGQTTTGSKYLRTALSEAAWGATRTKGTVLTARYHRLVRRTPKKAWVAIGHGSLRIVSHLLRRNGGSIDLGSEYFNNHMDRQRQLVVKRLAALGVQVNIEEVGQIA